MFPLSLCYQVMTMDDGKAKGFGFVSFEDHEAAAKVCMTCID